MTGCLLDKVTHLYIYIQKFDDESFPKGSLKTTIRNLRKRVFISSRQNVSIPQVIFDLLLSTSSRVTPLLISK